MQSKKFVNHWFWKALILGFFLVFFMSETLKESMFIDGVWYAVISRNLAEGNGSYWFPQFSQTIFSNFHEHPGFVFWIQSYFFKILGDSFWTERIFSGIQYLFNLILIVLIWKKIFSKSNVAFQNYWFVPILFWQFNILTYLYQPANLLDSPLSIFCLTAIYFLFDEQQSKDSNWKILLAAFFIFLAVLSKGIVGLFPLGFYGCFKLVAQKDISIQEVICKTIHLVILLMIFFVALLIVFPQALESINIYLDTQLFASLNGERRLYYYQNNRFFIVGQLLIVLLPMLIVYLGALFLKKFFNTQESNFKEKKLGFLFILIGLSASIPLIISPRQAMPYLIPALPYFTIGIGILVIPSLQFLLKIFIEKYIWVQRILSGGSISIVLLGLFLIFINFQKPNQRDVDTINDAKLIGEIVGEQQTISSNTYDMYISGYLMRYHKVSIDTLNFNKKYLLTKSPLDSKNQSYQLLPLKTKKYLLYEKN
ncbi:MAG: glycosyltransferase family 39 protein [Saprospiraceae bacterium]